MCHCCSSVDLWPIFLYPSTPKVYFISGKTKHIYLPNQLQGLFLPTWKTVLQVELLADAGEIHLQRKTFSPKSTFCLLSLCS